MKYLQIIVLALVFASCYKSEEPQCFEIKNCWYTNYQYTQCTFDKVGNPIFFNIKSDTAWSSVLECDVPNYIRITNEAIQNGQLDRTGIDKIFNEKYPSTCGCN